MNKVSLRFVLLLILGCYFATPLVFAEEQRRMSIIRGLVTDIEGNSLPGATVYLKDGREATSTDGAGHFRIRVRGRAPVEIIVSFIGYEKQSIKLTPPYSQEYITVKLVEESNQLGNIEVFGERGKQPDKLNLITRMPLRPSEQIQSISVISSRLIEEQGSLTITDAVQNVVGVSQFASYGGLQESLSARGYRGLPILKNGVRVQSDFRGTGFITDMQGIESIQVLKGSAALTQGVGNDLGSAGGVVNLATKTPKFVHEGTLSLRSGSW